MAAVVRERLEQIALTLQREISGEVIPCEPLSRHTTFGVGGPADLFVRVRSREDLRAVLQFCEHEEMPVWPIGDGSNLLVSDAGVRGAVVSLAGEFDQLRMDGDEVTVGAGVGMSRAISETAAAGLSGLDAVYGVPGSIGGGVFMNAGTKYGCVADTILGAWVARQDGDVEWVETPGLGLQYRRSALQDISPQPFVLEASFRLSAEAPFVIRERVSGMAGARKDSQPLNWRSCGCMFKNPAGDSAGRLIELAGLKSVRVGGVSVSDLHANFFLNDGSASASDVLTLVRRVQRGVAENCGVELDLEVRTLGDWPDE